MKEKEFEEQLILNNIYSGLELFVYWSLDENNNVIVDFDSMREEFDEKVRVLNEILEDKDELQGIVAEKLKQIKEKKDE